MTSTIDILINSYIPININFNNTSIFLYITKHYLNINSLCNTLEVTVDKWKRLKKINELINTQPNSFYSNKNKGSWISKSLYEDFT